MNKRIAQRLIGLLLNTIIIAAVIHIVDATTWPNWALWLALVATLVVAIGWVWWGESRASSTPGTDA